MSVSVGIVFVDGPSVLVPHHMLVMHSSHWYLHVLAYSGSAALKQLLAHSSVCHVLFSLLQ